MVLLVNVFNGFLQNPHSWKGFILLSLWTCGTKKMIDEPDALNLCRCSSRLSNDDEESYVVTRFPSVDVLNGSSSPDWAKVTFPFSLFFDWAV